MDEGECYEHCEHARRAMDGMEPQTNKTTRPAGATRALAACRSVCVRGGGMHVVCTGTAAIALRGGDGIAATKPNGMPLHAPYRAICSAIPWHGMGSIPWDGIGAVRLRCTHRHLLCLAAVVAERRLAVAAALCRTRPVLRVLASVHTLHYE